MLTKQLLIYKRKNSRLVPDRLNPQCEATRQLFARLTSAVACEPQRRAAWLGGAVAAGLLLPKQRRAVEKLITDRLEWEEPTPDFYTKRLQTLLEAEALRGSEPVADPETFRARLTARIDPELHLSLEQLYADRPAELAVTHFAELSPEGWIDTYNLSQAQGLALFARQLRLRCQPRGASGRRAWLRTVKFNRLVADWDTSGGPSGELALTLSGPTAILGTAQGYGLRFATFLKQICGFSDWEAILRVVPPRGPEADLVLCAQDFARRPSSTPSSYVPAEIAQLCAERDDLQIRPGAEIWSWSERLHVVHDFDCVVPAFSKTPVRVEVFHRWHEATLLPKLLHLAAHPTPGGQHFLFAIDKALWGRVAPQLPPTLQAAVEHHILVYRNFPTPSGLAKAVAAYWSTLRAARTHLALPPASAAAPDVALFAPNPPSPPPPRDRAASPS